VQAVAAPCTAQEQSDSTSRQRGGPDPRSSAPRSDRARVGVVYVVDVFRDRRTWPLVDALSAVKLVGHNIQFDITFLMHH